MENHAKISEILGDLLDMDPGEISPENYLIRELSAESIDLLEIAVTFNSEFGIDVDDDAIFLKNLRIHLEEAKEQAQNPAEHLCRTYPFIPPQRAEEILADVANGPVLKVKDLSAYVDFKLAA